MKKVLWISLLLCIVFAFAGCGGTDKYTATFVNGDAVVKTVEAEEGKELVFSLVVTPPQKPSDEEYDYVFRGWSTEKDGETVGTYTVTGDVTFYAVFRAVRKAQSGELCTVKFVLDHDGETVFTEEQQVKKGELATAPDGLPVFEGYTFDHWSRDLNEPIVADTTVYGYYAANVYSVKKHLPRNVLTETVRYGETLQLGAPSLPSFLTFGGWFTDEALQTPADGEMKMPAKDVDLYAACSIGLGTPTLTAAEGMVYGNTNRVRVEGLPIGPDYVYEWSDGAQGVYGQENYALLKDAGSYSLRLKVTATYGSLHAEATAEGNFTVAKRAVNVTLGAKESYVYGNEVSPWLSCENLARGDRSDDLGIAFKYSKDGADYVRGEGYLPAGQYTVSAVVGELKNYAVPEIAPVSFEVTKKPLSASLRVKEIVYGQTPAPALTFTGFAPGESGEVVSLGEGVFVYQKGEEPFTGEHFTAGEYTVRVAAEKLSAENYSFPQIPSVSFRVRKASLTVTLSTDKTAYVYGETPEIRCGYEGFVYEETAETIPLTPEFRYDGGQGEPLPAGNYRLTAVFGETENYLIAGELTCSFSVAKKELVPVISVGDSFTYGQTPALVLTFEGFIDGEDETAITRTGNALSYTRNGAPFTGEHFTAGKYTVKADLSRLRAANYSFAAGETAEFTVNKAAGKLDVSGVQKEYTYTGAEQKIESGATSNNPEDETIVYSNNRFTTVAEGNALNVTVRLEEGENYTGDTETFRITVQKMTISLPEGAEAKVEDQVNAFGKTLKDVPLPENFFWADETQALKLGEQTYPLFYNTDRANINDVETEVTFSTRKSVFTLTVTGGEADYQSNASADGISTCTMQIADEKGAAPTDEAKSYYTFTANGNITFAVGGTYAVTWELTVVENDYFEIKTEAGGAAPLSGSVYFKWKSVDVDGKLYTAEDALKLLDSGKTATVKYNTSFAGAEIAKVVYPDPAYYTIKAGATLLVPYGADDTGVTEQKNASTGFAAVSPTGYVTLTLPAGELVVNGKLIVNAYRVSNSNESSNVRGNQYGSLSLAKDAKVSVKSGATFESMGFTYGDGEVFAESGSTVWEPFCVPGWKGGAISTCVRNIVFPLNQYTASSFIAKLHVQAGATYSLRVALTANGSAQNGVITFVGTSNALMLLSAGQVTKYVTENDGKVHFDIEGTVIFGAMSIEVTMGSATTSGLQVPIPGHFAFDLLSGSVNIPKDIALKLLPGASFTTQKNTTLTVENGGGLYAYGSGNYSMDKSLTQWKDGNNGLAYPVSHVAENYRTKPNLGYTAATPATVTIKGTFVVAAGGKVGANFNGAEGANLQIEEGALTSNQIKEDYSTYAECGGNYMGYLSGKAGTFFTSTLNCGGLTAGNYLYQGGQWKKQA